MLLLATLRKASRAQVEEGLILVWPIGGRFRGVGWCNSLGFYDLRKWGPAEIAESPFLGLPYPTPWIAQGFW